MKLRFKAFSLIEVMVSLIILALLLTIVTNTSVGTAFFLKSINQSNKKLNEPEIGLALFQSDISHSVGNINSEFNDGSGSVSFARLLIDAHLLTPRVAIMEYDFGKRGIRRKLKFSSSDEWSVNKISEQAFTASFEKCYLNCAVSKLVLLDDVTKKERVVLYYVK
jgi:prepilin-type N-terminal cleavage/methylation domain-containing protein